MSRESRRAELRKNIREGCSACRTELALCDAGRLNDVVTALTAAVESLVRLSEEQDEDLMMWVKLDNQVLRELLEKNVSKPR